MKAAVVGLGKLGSVLAAVLAEAGNEVVGIDLAQSTVHKINQREAPNQEPELDDILMRLPDNQLIASTAFSLVSEAEVIMVVVPTPSDKEGRFSNEYVLEAINLMGPYVQRGQVVVICSTVMPGATDMVIKPALEAATHFTVGTDIGLCYSPEFIALGSVVHDMKHPDMVLIGTNCDAHGDILVSLLETFVQSDPPVYGMSYTEAEIAKIAVNAYVTMKISFANTIAGICEGFFHADARKILTAVGGDSRIGTKYLRPGASFGGPCFPRDNRAFAAVAEDKNVSSALPVATDAVNQDHTERVISQLMNFKRVAVLGLSYKPDTGVTEESMGVQVARSLAAAGVEVHAHDVLGLYPYDDDVRVWSDPEIAIDNADAVLVATAWPIYSVMNFRGLPVIDAWGCTMPQANRRVIGVGDRDHI